MGIIDLEGDWTTFGPWFGSAHSVSGDGEDATTVERLRRVVEEVTGKPLPAEEKRIGFY